MAQLTANALDNPLTTLLNVGVAIGQDCLEEAAKLIGAKRDQIIKLVSGVARDLRTQLRRARSPKGALDRLVKLIGQVKQLASDAAAQAGNVRSILNFDVKVECNLTKGIEAVVNLVGVEKFTRAVMEAKKTFQIVWNSILDFDLDFWYAVVAGLAVEGALKAVDMIESLVLGLIGGGADEVLKYVRRKGNPEQLYKVFSEPVGGRTSLDDQAGVDLDRLLPDLAATVRNAVPGWKDFSLALPSLPPMGPGGNQ